MKLTNNLNLPAVLVRALSADDYSKNTKYSVTQLLKPAQAVILEKRYWPELEADVSESLWRFIGSAVHRFLEKGEGKNDLTEERIAFSKTSGQLDYYESETKTIYDFKMTSVWAVVFESRYEEWQKQLSLYAFLLRQAGFEVKNIAAIVMMRNWEKRDYLRGKYDVPEPIFVKHFEILDTIEGEKIENWIIGKEHILDSYEKLPDHEQKPCTPAERWAKPGSYKIYWNESTAKNPTSQKNFEETQEAAARQYCEELNEKGKGKKTYRLEFIPGENWTRCEYCNAQAVCQQFLNREA